MPVTFKSRIPSIIAEMDVKVAAVVTAVAEDIANDAKARAPDPPPVGQYLKESIEAREGGFTFGGRSRLAPHASELGFATPLSKGVVAGYAYGVWAAWYWHFVEYGTSHSAPQPFMTPAIEGGRARLTAGVATALKTL